jgi:hypothetical protein
MGFYVWGNLEDGMLIVPNKLTKLIIEMHHDKVFAGNPVVKRMFKVYILLRVYIYYDLTSYRQRNTSSVVFFINLYHALHVSTTWSHHQVLQILVYNYQTVTFTFYILYTCSSSARHITTLVY